LPTGGGKTPVGSAITSTAYDREFRVWFVAPRNELVGQASKHLEKWGVPHGVIDSKHEESRAFRVHVVSKDTLLRRLHRIKNWPDLIIFDEAHLYYHAQKRIIACLPARTKIMGQSATPERFDGLGLSIEAGGIYEAIHYGPSIPWLTDRNFLVPLRYFAPPPAEGFDKLHWRGTEVVEKEYEQYIEKNKRVIYGNVIDYYRKYGRRANPRPGQNPNKPALIFTRSVKSAKETAAAFNDAGYNFRAIWGDMPEQEREFAFRALTEETIDGLVNCDLATYGVDLPNLEFGASIRPTLSLALYFQMVGRLLRPFIEMRCSDCGHEWYHVATKCPRCQSQNIYIYYQKIEAFFIDHANMVKDHQDPRYPGWPLFFIPDIEWNFNGRERRKRVVTENAKMHFCPATNEYCRDPRCANGCRLDPDAASKRAALEVVDVTLQERTPARGWTDLAPGERRDVQDRIGAATDAWLAALAEDPPRIDPGPVGELLAVAAELGRAPMWVYYFLTEKDDANRAAAKGMTLAEYRRMTRAVNVPLLYEIGRQARTKDGKPYARGWAYYKKRELEEAMDAERKEAALA
jgi:DNA repair protein RadD